MSKNLKEIWNLYSELGSTRKVSDVTGLSRRTVQRRLKDYKESIGNQESKVTSNIESILEQNSVDKKVINLILSQLDKDKKFKVSKKHNDQELWDFKDGKIVVFSDAHYIPNDEPTVSHLALLEVIHKLKPSAVVTNGDLADFSSISRHERIGWAKTYSVKDEIEVIQKRLSEIESVSGSAKLHMTLSNHDCRFNTYLSSNASQFEGLKGFELLDYFPNWGYSVSLFLNGQSAKIPTMIKHRFRGGVTASRQNVMNSGCNIITGHTHILDCTAFTTYRGTMYGIQTGTLSNPSHAQFNYAEHNPLAWQSGFVVLSFKDYELIDVELCRCNEEEAVFRGKVIVSKY